MSEETTTEEQVLPETQNEPAISLADFAAMLQVIDVCTTRGGFRGEELSSVGQLRDRVSAFLEFHKPEEAAEEAAEEEEAPADSDEAEA